MSEETIKEYRIIINKLNDVQKEINNIKQRVITTNSKIEDLTDALNKFVALRKPAPREPATDIPFQVDAREFPE
ncbi:unnamed protein product, partial [marine sediment metagenome]